MRDMRKRKWQKAAALIACVAMVGTATPDLTNVVNGSAFGDGTETDFISDENTDSVDFISGFSSGEEAFQDESGFEGGFSDMTADGTENENPAAEETVPAIPKARVLLEDAGKTGSQQTEEEAENSGDAGIRYQWIHVTSSVSEGEGNAKVCLTLTEQESKAPATKVKAALFAKQPEDFSSMEITDWAQLNAPVILENACNGNQNLNVNYAQDYARNENGEYITDENGNLTVTARYLEYEVPAGCSTDFYAAIAYSQEEETYTYAADLTAQATWKVDGEKQDILEKEEKNQIGFVLEGKADAEEMPEEDAEAAEDGNADEENGSEDAEDGAAEEDTENGSEDRSVEEDGSEDSAGAEDTENGSEDGSADVGNTSEDIEKEALVQISLTKELEEDPQAAEEVPNEEDVNVQNELQDSDVVEAGENAENQDGSADEISDDVIEETAVSGQAYAVHVTAQDLHQDSEGDITVKLNMKDTDTGLPLQGISTSFGKTKEEALSGETADTAQIPEGLNGQELGVSRIQESTEDENGATQLTSDYITFQLPAGETADFYIGITYTAQEEEYQRTLTMEAQAEQLITERSSNPAESAGQTTTENESNSQENTNPADETNGWSGDEQDADTTVSEDVAENTGDIAGSDENTESDAVASSDESTESNTAASSADNTIDMLSALPGALTTEFGEDAAESGANETAAEASNDIVDFVEATPSESTEEKKLVNVLNGTAAVMLAWAARSAQEATVYFAAPVNWETDFPGYEVKAWTIAGESGNGANIKRLTPMPPTNAVYNGQKVYSVTFTSEQMPYSGFYLLYFQAFVNKWKAQVVATENHWLAQSEFENKLYDSATGQWVDYTPFDPNDHTSFAGKTMYFENKKADQTLSKVTATFYEKDTDGKLQQVGDSIDMVGVDGKSNAFSVTIPSEACSYVQFTDENGNVLGDTYSNFYGQGTDEEGVESFIFTENSMDCYKYAGTAENSLWGALGERSIYFDATLSKLSYAGSATNGDQYCMPSTSGILKYYATGDGMEDKKGDMVVVSSHSENGHTWNDVYKVDLPEGYTKITFATFEMKNATNYGGHGESTTQLTIPTNLTNPCFYADTSDKTIYSGGQRDGYWDEVYTIRNAESKKSGKDVVDIGQSTFTRASNTLYVDSTFYDYYTDYELNGDNRDSYDHDNPTSGSQRSYVTFRQFDQALSDYYKSNGIGIPIYTGHFQPNYSNWGNPFFAIADTLNLFGYDKSNQNGFMSTNNSTLNANGNSTYYDAAAQGLVSGTLSNGNLMASGGKAQEPHFNESFLSGANSKNTVLGEVYHNVAFPFTKQKLDIKGNKCDSNTANVDYWYFDSADTTLAMRQDASSGEYYLQNTGNQNWSKNVNSSSQTTGVSNTYGFFPFNETATACSASNYNYGFGTKLEFKFRLTEDGQVTASDGTTKFPIQFTFSGDDDVWVYVDGKLALDVGGAHGRVTGTIDFSGEGKTKRATVSSTKVSQGSGTEGTNVTSNFDISGGNTSEHTLTMFYMERGMWESNMKVSFNFPDENQLQVEKQVDKTDVNDLFKDLFENMSMFNFSIKNLATHYESKAVDLTGSTAPVKVTNYSAAPSYAGNTFKTSSTQGGELHWYAKENDKTSSYRDKRYGDLTLNDTVDISNMAYLEFKFYYDYADTPSLSNMYLQLVDSSGKKAGDIETTESLSGRTYGSVTPKGGQWITVKLDLSRMSWENGFDKKNLKILRFGYNYPRNIYLKDFVFQPTATYTGTTGFVTKQYDIPDYGSATSGKLEIPNGATYTSSNGGTYRIGEDGTFVLQDKETVTFKDQFRRGSYIYLKEEADPNLFETTWTMYENGQAVTSTRDGNTVNIDSVRNLANVSGSAVEDGRTEKYLTGWDEERKIENELYKGDKPSDSTFVFRSYSDPDNTTSTTKLKAVFYNKVKTGSLKLIKSPAYDADHDLNGTYEFKITFTNVGGMGLETAPIVLTKSLKLNEVYEIEGIPVGTFFSIEELPPKDGSSLDSILLNGKEQESGATVVNGDISSAGSEVEVMFRNTKKPLVNISVEKVWNNENGTSYNGKLPEKVYVQLQRKADADGSSWESFEYNGRTYTEITHNIYTNKWECSFTGLDKYEDYTQNPRVPWLYRVVEVKVITADGGNGNTTETVTPIENGNVIELSSGKFTVTYDVESSNITFPENSDTGKETITNTYQPPKTNIQLLKIKAGTAENPEKLSGATFSIEKLLDNGDTDSNFTKINATTDEEGLVIFTELEDGIYRITETKAPEGYSLLKSPIIVVINRRDNSNSSITVDGGENVINKLSGDTITIQVADQKKFELPATGSWSRLILGFSGAILIGMSVIMYLLQKRRKGVKTS